MITLINLIKALPAIIKLLQELQKRIDEAETNRKVVDDIKSIHGAFNDNDPSQLNHLFSNGK